MPGAPNRCAVILLALGVLCPCLLADGGVGAAQQSLAGTVTHVADGDTLDITSNQHTFIIRLEGIDAPERRQAFGTQARNFLRALAFSRPATARVLRTDRYGRLVARVFVAGKDLSEEMLRAGFAWHYTDYSSDPRLAALEKDARARRAGLWADRSPVPPWVARRPGATRVPPTTNAARTRPTPGPSSQASGPFHGNVKSHVYHAVGCADYSCANCREVFASRGEAEAAGYRPHAECVNRRR